MYITMPNHFFPLPDINKLLTSDGKVQDGVLEHVVTQWLAVIVLGVHKQL